MKLSIIMAKFLPRQMPKKIFEVAYQFLKIFENEKKQKTKKS